MKIIRVPVDAIEVTGQRRALDEAWAEALAESIDQGGLLHPIHVSKQWPDGRRGLITGMHRLAAYRLLGRPEIEAIEFTGRNASEALAEVDENLFRRNLSPLDRAAAFATRKEIYEAKHPETKRGGDRGNQHTGGKPRQNEIFSFSQETALKIDMSRKTVEDDVAMYIRLALSVRERLAAWPTPWKRVELERLSKLDPDQQAKALDLMQAEENPAPNVAAARRIIEGHAERQLSPDEEQYLAILRPWDRASDKVKKRFVEFLRGEGLV